METYVLDWVLMIGCVVGGLLLAGLILVAAGVWFGGHNTQAFPGLARGVIG